MPPTPLSRFRWDSAAQGGGEIAHKTALAYLGSHPTSALLMIDCRSAFQEIRRDKVVVHLAARNPQLLSWASPLLYARPTNVWKPGWTRRLGSRRAAH